MARGTTLATLRTLLRSEVGDTQETNTFADAEYNYLLATKQKEFAMAYDWTFLEHKWDLACAAGSRYLAQPTTDIRSLACTINFERPVLVERLFNSKYECIDYGIGSEEFNYRNSDTGETLDPIMRWRIATNTPEAANEDQVEIWPIPVTAQTVRFTGQRNLLALTSDSDKADLDDLLIVLTVAAEVLAKRQQPNAGLTLQRAKDRLIKLRSGYPTNDIRMVLGKGREYERKPRTAALIVVA